LRIMLNFIKSAKSRANSTQESKPDQEARFFKNKYTMKLYLSKFQSLRIIFAKRSKPNPPNANSKSPGTYLGCLGYAGKGSGIVGKGVDVVEKAAEMGEVVLQVVAGKRG
nr:hypothetical protein [Tanacetum cinerariifolium]